MQPHPDGLPEIIVITKGIPSGKNHTGDLVDIGDLFAIGRWAVRKDNFGEWGCAWIPSWDKWDHVFTSITRGQRIPFTEASWRALLSLEPAIERLQEGILKLVRQGAPLDPGAVQTAFDEARTLLVDTLRDIRKKSPA